MSKRRGKHSNDSFESSGSRHWILREVLPYLGPQELYNCIVSCKELYGLLTYELVMRSVVLTPTETKSRSNNLSYVISLMEKGFIHIPSPFRLLRITALGRHCEHKDCKKPKGRVLAVDEDFGLFFCSKCSSQSSSMAKNMISLVSNPASRFVHGARVAHQRGGLQYVIERIRLIKAPFTDATGEKIGPLCTIRSLDPLLKFKEDQMLEEHKKIMLTDPDAIACDRNSPTNVMIRELYSSLRSEGYERKWEIRTKKDDKRYKKFMKKRKLQEEQFNLTGETVRKSKRAKKEQTYKEVEEDEQGGNGEKNQNNNKTFNQILVNNNNNNNINNFNYNYFSDDSGGYDSEEIYYEGLEIRDGEGDGDNDEREERKGGERKEEGGGKLSNVLDFLKEKRGGDEEKKEGRDESIKVIVDFLREESVEEERKEGGEEERIESGEEVMEENLV